MADDSVVTVWRLEAPIDRVHALILDSVGIGAELGGVSGTCEWVRQEAAA